MRLFQNILFQLLAQPVEIVEGDELEIKGWCKNEKEFTEKIVESACCIANARGGVVIGGVEGKMANFSTCPHANVSANWLEERVKNLSYPPVDCEAFDLTELLAAVRGTTGATAFGLMVPKSRFLTSHVTSSGVSKIRHGRECKPYFTTADDDRTRAVVHGLSVIDLSIESIKWAIARHEAKFGPGYVDEDPWTFLARMLLLVPVCGGGANPRDYQVTLAALLLFGKERSLQSFHHDVETIVSFDGGTSRVTKNIVESIRELVIAEKSPVKQRCSGVSREVLFELFMNAYVHRCWRTPGPIVVHINSILEIQNPGELLPGLNVTNLLHCIPSYRNFLLAESCRHVGLSDKLGKGIGLVFDSALKGGLPVPIFESRNNAFSVRLSMTISDNFRQFIRVRSPSLSSMDEILCLRALLDRKDLGTEELAQVLQRSVDQTQLVLAAMAKKLMIEECGNNRARLTSGVRHDIERIYSVNQMDLFHG
jgi:ATP-dependent DNA helicase RecG